MASIWMESRKQILALQMCVTNTAALHPSRRQHTVIPLVRSTLRSARSVLLLIWRRWNSGPFARSLDLGKVFTPCQVRGMPYPVPTYKQHLVCSCACLTWVLLLSLGMSATLVERYSEVRVQRLCPKVRRFLCSSSFCLNVTTQAVFAVQISLWAMLFLGDAIFEALKAQNARVICSRSQLAK